LPVPAEGIPQAKLCQHLILPAAVGQECKK